MSVVRWQLTMIDDGHVDFRPVDDEIDHEVGPGCVCGPREIKPTDTSPEIIYRHLPLRTTHGGY